MEVLNDSTELSKETVSFQPDTMAIYRNQLYINYLYINHDDKLYASSIGSLEYVRKAKKTTLVGRLNSTLRNEELGVQLEVDGYQVFEKSNYIFVNLGLADRFFPKMKAGFSYYQAFKNIGQLEIGSRYFYNRIDEDHRFFGVLGAEREFKNTWVNVKFTFELDEDFRKYLLIQGRYFVKNEKDYLTLMGGWGNMPEVNDLNYLAQHPYSIDNFMLGAGYNLYLTDQLPLKFVFNWYNYQVNESVHSNQFHGFVSLGYLF